MLESGIFGLLKLFFAIPMIFLGGYGIFISNYLGAGTATLVSFLILIRKFKVNIFSGFNWIVLKEVGKYSAGSYLINLLGILPAQLLPALVTKQIDSVSAAYFFLAQMMVNLLLIIPQANNQALFSQASKMQDLFKTIAIKSLKLQFVLLGSGLLFIWFFGGYVLSVFGKGYHDETLQVLRILSLTAIPVTLSYPFATRLRVLRKIGALFWISCVGMITILTSCYVGSNYGLSGIAVGYVFGQLIGTTIFIINYRLSTHNQ
jgi:O-antigen/teichoic acid export membrane protein